MLEGAQLLVRAEPPPRGVRADTRRPRAGPRPQIAELVDAAREGEHGAWDALVARFAPTVWAIARGHRLSAADAADVSQTTWLRFFENLYKIEQPERVGAWLATTARRESLRVLRLAGRQVPTGEDMDVVLDPGSFRTPEHHVAAEEQRRLISQLVTRLPIRSQLLLRILSADSPLSYRDTSEVLEMPVGSIGPTRARALEQLRRLAVEAGLHADDVLL